MTTALTGSLLAYLRVEYHPIDEPPALRRARGSALADESFVEFILGDRHAHFSIRDTLDRTQSYILLHPMVYHIYGLMRGMRLNDSEGHGPGAPGAIWAFFGHNTS